MSLFKNEIHNYYVNKGYQECQQKPNLRTYITFKNNFETEPYILMYMNRQQRSLLAQLCSCVCSKYEIHRKVLFSQDLAANNEFQDLCNNEKLVYLMRNEIKALSTFLQEA